MCTAITFCGKEHYFGRNLDLEYSYHEEVIVLPRNFPLEFRNGVAILHHPAWIGMATVADGYPLYYDATNEYGLSVAGLNFPGNAAYHPAKSDFQNIASFELIPWVLAQCKTTKDATQLLSCVNLWDISFSDDYPTTPLHWIIADAKESITVEPMTDGLHIYSNPIGILTNNPPFDYHLQHLTDYLNLRPDDPINPYSDQIRLVPYSRGQGAIGLPGDLSSASRFIKAAYTKLNALKPKEDSLAISQFFHILSSVEQQEGCVKIGDQYEKTVYSSCCNIDTGVYYYTTYYNRQITGICMHHSDLNSSQLTRFQLRNNQDIRFEN